MSLNKSHISSNETKVRDVCLLLQLPACIARLLSSDIVRHTAYCVNGSYIVEICHCQLYRVSFHAGFFCKEITGGRARNSGL